MGYCAKVISFSQFACIAILVVNRLYAVHCASLIPSKSWPSLKTYDIWGSPADTQNEDETMQTKHNRITASNEILLQDYRDKTSLRNGKVLNFFSVPSEDECKTEDGRRSGVCMNVYECHQKGGSAKGQCALGFGSCCVFTATCDQEVKNNITYIVSPSFPALMSSDIKSCKLKIKMISPDISQLRFDFVHFSVGQPNRRNGNCDGDIFSLIGGAIGDFKLCGHNNGQHIYYDVPSGKARDAEEAGIVDVVMNFTSSIAAARFWEIRVSQIPFSQRAPAGCLQYFFGTEGVIQTFNFAENGRHLSNQKYKACIRQESGMCSIMYEPCSEQSFRIGPTQQRQYPNGLYSQSPYADFNNPFYNQNPYYPNPALNNPIFGANGMFVPNGAAGAGIITPNGIIYGSNGIPTGVIGPNGMLNALNPNALAAAQMSGYPLTSLNPGAGGPSNLMNPQYDQPIQADQLPLNDTFVTNSTTSNNATNNQQSTTTTTSTTPVPLNDDLEGSGDDADQNENDANDVGTLFSIGSFITRAALFRSFKSESRRMPRQYFSTCTDRITLPCIVEDFISVGTGSVPTCSPIHCGNSLCPPGIAPCRVESTVTPFGIGIHFGDGTNKGSAEDNIGACIRYKQMNCV